MTSKRFIITAYFLYSLSLTSTGSGFTRDTLSLFAVPIGADSFEVYLKVNGTWASNCTLDCHKVDRAVDTVLFYAGYYVGNSTVICPVMDTFYLGHFVSGLIRVKATVGGNVIVNCDSFYTKKIYLLSLLLEATKIREPDGNDISLFPNPATDNIKLGNINVSSNTQIEVLSIDGMVISIPFTISKSSIEIDVSTLPAGLYFLQLQEDKQRVVKKFVKY
jgi:hypothetical protein